MTKILWLNFFWLKLCVSNVWMPSERLLAAHVLLHVTRLQIRNETSIFYRIPYESSDAPNQLQGQRLHACSIGTRLLCLICLPWHGSQYTSKRTICLSCLWKILRLYSVHTYIVRKFFDCQHLQCLSHRILIPSDMLNVTTNLLLNMKEGITLNGLQNFNWVMSPIILLLTFVPF